ncbi:phage major capsid protein [Alteriqipengyuania lutimaris]|uniref:Phage major capsid protein n=1 Tax=Alteriqipengyuania lutimaris TaxID=1538146 RepID=A0A395LQR2_9SPHN|nr:phage major capsid protein [Alteriqipengyuania lutimaris]MBB3034048.1 HK97 family phage major capsid protein [Alteriqipengyuania lutimaris]RDS77010.1 phage major capsid protein [Alteriqipengyuania lutimaris]
MTTETKSVAELATELKGAFETKLDEVKAFAEDALGKAQANESLTASQKEQIDGALTEMNELKSAFSELEQKMTRGGSRDEAPKTPGQAFVESAEFKAAFPNGAQQGRSVSVETKAITSLTTDADGSAGDLVRAERVQAAYPNLPDRRLTIRGLVAAGQTSASSIEYVQETGFTNNAGMTAEGAAKPESSLKFDLKQAPVRKIAHWMKASAEILSDAPALRSMIDSRLRYGLAFVEDVQLLKGDGTGQNLLGIKPQAADYAAPDGFTGPDPLTKIDILRIAQLQVALAEYPADGQVLHPIDWAEIELTKDGEGRYIIGNPQGTAAPTLWGLPVVPTQAQTVGEFTVGAWGTAAQLFDRMQSQVVASTENQDDFIKNMVTILAEERLAFTVYRTDAFVDGAFPAPAA